MYVCVYLFIYLFMDVRRRVHVYEYVHVINIYYYKLQLYFTSRTLIFKFTQIWIQWKSTNSYYNPPTCSNNGILSSSVVFEIRIQMRIVQF